MIRSLAWVTPPAALVISPTLTFTLAPKKSLALISPRCLWKIIGSGALVELGDVSVQGATKARRRQWGAWAGYLTPTTSWSLPPLPARALWPGHLQRRLQTWFNLA